MAGKKKLKKYRMAVGICGPTVLYSNIIRAYSAEEAARLYLSGCKKSSNEITDEIVADISNKMYEIEETKSLDNHYDACGKLLEIGDMVFCVVKTEIVEGTIVKLTNRSVKITSNKGDCTIIIGKDDYKEIKGKKEPYFAKIIKITNDITLGAEVEVGAFVAYLMISFGTCTGFGFGTVVRITPSYIHIDTGKGEMVRKSADKVQRLR